MIWSIRQGNGAKTRYKQGWHYVEEKLGSPGSKYLAPDMLDFWNSLYLLIFMLYKIVH